jgi:membrane-bound ClpP family serine protease
MIKTLVSKTRLLVRSHIEKALAAHHPLIGTPAVAYTALDPDGAVLVDGELWVAKSTDGEFVPASSQLLITGSTAHTLLVTTLRT